MTNHDLDTALRRANRRIAHGHIIISVIVAVACGLTIAVGDITEAWLGVIAWLLSQILVSQSS